MPMRIVANKPFKLAPTTTVHHMTASQAQQAHVNEPNVRNSVRLALKSAQKQLNMNPTPTPP